MQNSNHDNRRTLTADSTADRRRFLIMEELAQRQVVRVARLSKQFGVSEVSIRRDLEYLERQGFLTRIHGGAVAVRGANVDQRSPAPTRSLPHVEEKERIGRAAAELVRRGDRLLLDSGTTVLQVARHLPPDLLNAGNLTVITGSLPVVREIGPWQGTHLILLGGVYLPSYEVVVGPQTIEQIRNLHVDRLFLGSDGLSYSHGVTTANVLEAEVDRAAIAAASEIIVVADSSKIGVIGLTTILPLSGMNKLITDTNAPADFVADLRAQGVEVILV